MVMSLLPGKEEPEILQFWDANGMPGLRKSNQFMEIRIRRLILEGTSFQHRNNSPTGETEKKTQLTKTPGKIMGISW